MKPLLLIAALPFILAACATTGDANGIPKGKARPVNTPAEIQRLAYVHEGLAVVGPQRDDKKARARLFTRPADSADYATVQGVELVNRTVTVNFKSGGWKVVMNKDDSYRFMLLKAVATNVRVTGYTDAKYNTPANERMAARRAQAGVDYLLDRGFPADRISVATMASGGHVAGNDTKEGRAKNRRLEFEFFTDDWVTAEQ